MDKLISPNLLAFLKARMLVDGMVAIIEVIHLAKRKKKARLIFMVDFEKAYDSISWRFQDYMFIKVGFIEN